MKHDAIYVMFLTRDIYKNPISPIDGHKLSLIVYLEMISDFHRKVLYFAISVLLILSFIL